MDSELRVSLDLFARLLCLFAVQTALHTINSIGHADLSLNCWLLAFALFFVFAHRVSSEAQP
jgi:hypothetical protein